MFVFVKGLDGASVCVDCCRNDTITNLKHSVSQVTDIDASLFSLSSGLRYFSNDTLLADCGVEDGSVLYMNTELLGAGKKRKKKQYTTPKKIKHKKKKVKLAVLKYYKVDANNKVSRLRIECPNTTCGAGVFMAKHNNRTYCGRCSMSYIVPASREE